MKNRTALALSIILLQTACHYKNNELGVRFSIKQEKSQLDLIVDNSLNVPICIPERFLTAASGVITFSSNGNFVMPNRQDEFPSKFESIGRFYVVRPKSKQELHFNLGDIDFERRVYTYSADLSWYRCDEIGDPLNMQKAERRTIQITGEYKANL